MGKKSRAKRNRIVIPSDPSANLSLRTWWIVGVVCASFVPVLVRVHTLGALAGVPISHIIPWTCCDALSRHVFGKPFTPPSKYPPYNQTAFSDWLLFVPYVLAFVSLLFAFGTYANWARGEHKWKW